MTFGLSLTRSRCTGVTFTGVAVRAGGVVVIVIVLRIGDVFGNDTFSLKFSGEILVTHRFPKVYIAPVLEHVCTNALRSIVTIVT